MQEKPETIFPERPGVYFFKHDAHVLYVGKALSLKQRVGSYFDAHVPEKTRLLVEEANKIEFIETGSEFEALLLEANYIKKYRPHYNISLKDDKSYIYIFISNHEVYPKVILARKPKNISFKKGPESFEGFRGTYLGPYPSSNTARQLLKTLRKIFPFCQSKTLNKPCFYSHLGLCNPCPGIIESVKDTGLKKKLLQKYRKNVLYLVRILKGKLLLVEKTLESDMKKLSKAMAYEEASIRRNQLRILHMTCTSRRVEAFMENSNYYSESQQSACLDLQQQLLPFFPKLPKLIKIECYDISHFSGNLAVGSMTVLLNGIPEKNMYRRFKIKSNANSDVDSLAEMLKRRLKHSEWELPQLILVDGGKPQVSKISQVMAELNFNISIVGLAKRWEELVILHTNQFILKRLSRNSASLQLLQIIRDEAHRFGLKYHRLLRRKAF